VNRERPGEISFWVPGKPEPGGSKRSIPAWNKRTRTYAVAANGRPIINTVDDNPKAKGWKEMVALIARTQYKGDPIPGPVRLDLQFYLKRPAGHVGKGRNAGNLRAAARQYPTVKPDVLKMARVVEDALSGLVYVDDAQIIHEVLLKQYGPNEGVRIEVTRIGVPA